MKIAYFHIGWTAEFNRSYTVIYCHILFYYVKIVNNGLHNKTYTRIVYMTVSITTYTQSLTPQDSLPSAAPQVNHLAEYISTAMKEWLLAVLYTDKCC